MQTVTTKCDYCGADISHTDLPMSWRLTLTTEPVRRRPGTNASLGNSDPVDVPLDRPHHFCGLGCLADWLAERP